MLEAIKQFFEVKPVCCAGASPLAGSDFEIT